LVNLQKAGEGEGMSFYNHLSLETSLAATQRLVNQREATNGEAILKIFFIIKPNPILV